jgi:hypothetical protein
MEQRQVHLWMSEGEYQLLRELAQDRGESVSSLVRRLVRVYRLLHPDPAPRAAARTRQEVGPQIFG